MSREFRLAEQRKFGFLPVRVFFIIFKTPLLPQRRENLNFFYNSGTNTIVLFELMLSESNVIDTIFDLFKFFFKYTI
jgi:hypothetical protein